MKGKCVTIRCFSGEDRERDKGMNRIKAKKREGEGWYEETKQIISL
jgi:hypothetical protein